MITHILSAEHIGLVAAYLSKIVLYRAIVGEKHKWIEMPLVQKKPDWRRLTDENRNDWESKAFIEIQVYPTGQWAHSETIRKGDNKNFAGSRLVEYARNIASAIAHLNEVGHNYEGGDGPFHETMERVRQDREHRSRFRGFSFERKGGEEFRQAAAWAAESYLDNKPSVKPIPLAKLIHEVKQNLAIHDEGLEEYRERFTDIYYKLQELCDVAIVKALWHSKTFKESPETWQDKDLYDQFLTQKEVSEIEYEPRE